MTDKNHPLLPETKHGENPSSIPEDEVNFIELLEVLIRKKAIILVIFAIFTSLSIGYSLWVTPIYRAKVGILPPRGIVAPEWIPKDLTTETNESIYKQFLTRIKSYKGQQEVFDREGFFNRFASDSKNSTPPEKVFLKIHDSITVKNPVIKTYETIYIQMEGSKPEVIADFLNSLSKTTIKNIQTETQNLLQTKINNRLKAISIKIAHWVEMKQMGVEMKQMEQQSRIKFLTEQLGIARKINIKKNNFGSTNDKAPLWYLYGEFYLEEEINSLKSKINAPSKNLSTLESFKGKTAGLIKLEFELKELKSMDVLLVKPEVALISQPSTLKKPSQKKLVLLGMLLGLSVGIIFAFISNAIASRKERKYSSAHS